MRVAQPLAQNPAATRKILKIPRCKCVTAEITEVLVAPVVGAGWRHSRSLVSIRSACSFRSKSSVVTMDLAPRRIQLSAVERGIPSWAKRAGSRASQTRSRRRWSWARRQGRFTGRGWSGRGNGASTESYDVNREKAQGFHGCCTCTASDAECSETQLCIESCRAELRGLTKAVSPAWQGSLLRRISGSGPSRVDRNGQVGPGVPRAGALF